VVEVKEGVRVVKGFKACCPFLFYRKKNPNRSQSFFPSPWHLFFSTPPTQPQAWTCVRLSRHQRPPSEASPATPSPFTPLSREMLLHRRLLHFPGNIERDTAATSSSPLALTGDAWSRRRCSFSFSREPPPLGSPLSATTLLRPNSDDPTFVAATVNAAAVATRCATGDAKLPGVRLSLSTTITRPHSSVHATTSDHTPVQSFESPVVFCF